MKSLNFTLFFAILLLCCLSVYAEDKSESLKGGSMESDIIANLETIARKSITPVNIEILRNRGHEPSANKVIFPSNSLQHVDRAYINMLVATNSIFHAIYSSNMINLTATIAEGILNPLDYKLSRMYEETLSVQQWIGILNRENPDLRAVFVDTAGIREKPVSLSVASGSTIRTALNQLSATIGVRWKIYLFKTAKQFQITSHNNQEVPAMVEGPRSEIFFIKLSQSGMPSAD